MARRFRGVAEGKVVWNSCWTRARVHRTQGSHEVVGRRVERRCVERRATRQTTARKRRASCRAGIVDPIGRSSRERGCQQRCGGGQGWQEVAMSSRWREDAVEVEEAVAEDTLGARPEESECRFQCRLSHIVGARLGDETA